jgi:hypothetical protein
VKEKCASNNCTKHRYEVVKNHQIMGRKSAYQFTADSRHSDFPLRAVNISTMDFPPDWRVDSMEDFDVAVATLTNSGEAVAVELLAQLRPNGWILDNFWIAVNGSQILDMELDFNNLLPSEPLRDYKLHYQYCVQPRVVQEQSCESRKIGKGFPAGGQTTKSSNYQQHRLS